jgi:hypothetical protein
MVWLARGPPNPPGKETPGRSGPAPLRGPELRMIGASGGWAMGNSNRQRSRAPAPAHEALHGGPMWSGTNGSTTTARAGVLAPPTACGR